MGEHPVLIIYSVIAFVFLVILLVEWWPQRSQNPFWVIIFGAVLWPFSLAIFIEHLWTRKSSR